MWIKELYFIKGSEFRVFVTFLKSLTVKVSENSRTVY